MCVDPIDTVVIMRHNLSQAGTKISTVMYNRFFKEATIQKNKTTSIDYCTPQKFKTHMQSNRHSYLYRLLVLNIILLNKYNLVDGGTLDKYLQEFEF